MTMEDAREERRETDDLSLAAVQEPDAADDVALSSADADTDAPGLSEGDDDTELSVGRSTALMSVLVVVSRITGFMRTWAQAFGMGATVLASCYELASNMPTQIYELVTAGMLVTAFLPAYVSVKKRLGRQGANDYVSNLVSIVLIITGAVTLISFIFAGQIIWTQSFSAAEDFDSARATWFFRFFVIEIVLYALSTIFSGVVNAERDYLWSSIAPIFNNVVVMASFIAYGALAETNPSLGLIILAIGNPLGVVVQVLLQVPSMWRHGIRLRWHIDLHDPALKDTVKIGVPSIVVMVLGFVTNAFQMNALLSYTAIGASIGSYAMLWFNLPYAIFCVPIMTVLFTELSDYFAADDMESFRSMVSSGIGKILFMLVPFSFFLAVFSDCLVAIISAGRFSESAADLCAYYLIWRAPSLAVYGVGMYLQKVCSATRKMEVYAVASVICGIIQIALLQFVAPYTGLWMVPFTSCIFFVVFDVYILLVLQRSFGRMGLRAIIVSLARSLAFGVLGCAVAWGILQLMTRVMGGYDGSVMGAILRCVVAGLPAVLVTYGTAVLLKVPEASTVNIVLDRLLHRAR